MLGFELLVIWGLYVALGLVTAYEPPLWLTAGLILLVDRSISAVSRVLTAARKR
ncbi:MAG: hypothetical protein AAGD04_12330 [Pseudomonadota bacterium]